MKLKTNALRTIGLNLLLAITLAGCATGQPGEAVNHAFEIASTYDSKNLDIQYIGYCYGDPKIYSYSVETCSVETPTQKASNGGRIDDAGTLRVRDTLWVKWRNLKTGKVFEETVNLQKAWPSGFNTWLLYAHVKNDRLEVFVISRHPQPEREYFTTPQYHDVQAYEHTKKLSYRLAISSRDKIHQIHPMSELDPHLPPELRRKK